MDLDLELLDYFTSTENYYDVMRVYVTEREITLYYDRDAEVLMLSSEY